ncbi:MAG: glycosyltransferase [Epulopiscium sp.]|nr:glycosyltransferase [Candidatus Epulonipiscium sp.]HOQ17714.1 glycosyltransferase [Defluviitaleaceae bacterium]HPT75584.1 glycosyltransferase [Defluviitaleaceae bacterium]
MKKKIYLCFSLVLLLLLISYKIYIVCFGLNFQSLNYNNIKKIQEKCKEKDEITFAVIGDIKSSVERFDKKHIGMLNKEEVDFIISTGNALADGSRNKYRILNKSISKLNIPFITAVGEGEVSEDGALRYYKHFGPLYFSFATEDSYFIFMDTTGHTSQAWQKDWLIEELDKASHYKNRFVFMNKPLYKPDNIEASQVKDLCIKDKEFCNFLIKTFSEKNVTGVFSSNIGVYDQKIIEGVPYYITGGAGGPLLLDNPNSYYHYLKVKLSGDNAVVEVKRFDEQTAGGFWESLSSKVFYLYSLFKINFVNILLVINIIYILISLIYIKFTKEVDYYSDFDINIDEGYQNKKLNIAMFTNNYFPFVGGVPISIERLSRGLRKLGHNVYIFAPEYPQGYNDDESVIRCKLITYYETDQFDFPIVNVFLKEIEREFLAKNIDIVHVHHPFGMGHKGVKLGRKHKLPVVFTYHTRFEKYAHNVPIGSEFFKSTIPHKIIKKFAQDCSLIIAPTQSAKDYLKQIGVIRPVEVMPTGIEFESYEKMDFNKVENIRKVLATEGEVLLISVSRLTKEKNLSFLLDGIKYVRENTKKKFKCLIVGDGPEKQKLQETIDNYNLRDTVLLLGTIDPKEIIYYYEAANIFVFASRSETQGMVLLEAMAGHCPVVAVRSSGTDDMIIEGENGFKTKEDIKLWGEKVIELIENDELRETMSQKAYDFSKGFSIDNMAKKAEKVYYGLLKMQEEMLAFDKNAAKVGGDYHS